MGGGGETTILLNVAKWQSGVVALFSSPLSVYANACYRFSQSSRPDASG